MQEREEKEVKALLPSLLVETLWGITIKDAKMKTKRTPWPSETS